MTLRAALYHRVSTSDQDAEGARETLTDAARQRGLDVVLDIRETGSGARNDRPGLRKLLKAASGGKIDVVMVHKLDRFGRSALDLLANLRYLADCGVRFIAVTQGIDIGPDGDAMSRLQVNMLAAFAEFERALISDRTKLGLANARKRGVRLGRPRKDRPSAETIRALRDQGLSWTQVAAKLGCSRSHARRALNS